MTNTSERRVRRARPGLRAAALAGALLAAGCAGNTYFVSSDPYGVVVIQLDNQYAAQSSLSTTVIGYDDAFETVISQSASGNRRMATATSSDLGPYYVFGLTPGTYVIRDVSRASGETGRCFAQGTVAFDVRAGTAVFIGAVTDTTVSAGSASRAALATNDHRFGMLAWNEGNASGASAAFAEAIKSRVALTSGGDPHAVTFDLRRSAADAVGNTCRRAGG